MGYYLRLNRGWHDAAAGPFFEQMIDSSYIVQSIYPWQNTNVSFVLNIYNGKAMNFTFHSINIQTKSYLNWIVF